MSSDNKLTLQKANEAITKGDHETFLSYCTNDTTWTFVGDQTLHGKEAVGAYLAKTYLEPPRFQVDNLIADGDFLTAVGKISLLEDGLWVDYDYCDVWKFRNGLMHELRGFVIKNKKK